MPKIKQNILLNWQIYCILLIALILRLFYMSPYLEDWDSVQFALALHNYSIIDQQPHPPGYPVYVLLAKSVNLLINNDLLSLNLVSIFLGTLAALPLFYLIKKITNNNIAILCSILFLVTPVEWTLSLVALSNIPGLFFTVLSALFIYLGKKSDKYLTIGSFLSGITLGVRFAEYSMLIPLIVFVLLQRKQNKLLQVIAFFCLGVLIWLVPMLFKTGLGNFINAYKIQAGYIINHDSLLSQSSFLRLRIIRLFDLLKWGYTIYFIPLAIFPVILSFKKISAFKEFSVVFGIIWFISYFIPLLFIYNLEITRFTLPLLPPVIFLTAIILYKIQSKILLSTFILIICLVGFNGYFQAEKIHSLVPPTIAPVIYIQKYFEPNKITLVTTFTYRQFQYYLPDITNYYGPLQASNRSFDTKYVVIDFLGIQDDLPQLRNYKMIDQKQFSQPEIFFPRLSNTNLYIFEKI